MHITKEEAKQLYDDRIEQPKSAFWMEHDSDATWDSWEIKERRVIWLYPINRHGVAMITKRTESTIDYDVCTCYDEERAGDILSMLRNREQYKLHGGVTMDPLGQE